MKIRIYLFTCIIIFVSASGCYSKRNVASDMEEQEIHIKQILKDIAQLDKESYGEFLNGGDYQKAIKQNKELFFYSTFYYQNRCFVHVEGLEEYAFGPLEEDKYSNLVLAYSKNNARNDRWILDTVFTTYPEFYQLKDSSDYFRAGTQRCKLGNCEWYYTILKIKGNSMEEFYNYTNFSRLDYIEYQLQDNQDVFYNPGDTIVDNHEIVNYEWNNETLKSISFKRSVSILKGIEGDSLLLANDTLYYKTKW